jgi:SAM-dependent methyltransferase
MARYTEDISSRFTGRHKACIRFSGNLTGKRVLDIGCWIGWYENLTVKKGCKFIVGIDVDADALRKAKKSTHAINCEFVCASATILPFKQQSFDAVSMFDVLEHLPIYTEYDCFYEENRVLQTGGFAILSVPNKHFLSKIMDPAYFLIGHRHYGCIQIQSFLKKTGFEVQKVNYAGGIVEGFSVFLLYFFKHFLNSEVPFKLIIEDLRWKEYQEKGFQTLFVQAIKTQSLSH